MTPTRRTQSFLVQLIDLTLIQLANWRWSWRSTLLTSLAAPLMSTAALGFFASNSGSDTLGYILTGNMVMSLLFGTFDKVAGHFAYMRLVGRLTFFATLPIYRTTLVLATVCAFLMLALPTALVTLLAGSLILDMQLDISPWLIVVLPLIGMPMCGLGALIGIVVNPPEQAGSFSTLITFLLVGSGPVVFPRERLPEFVQTLSFLSPATYAASALRQTVLNMPDQIPLAADLAALAGFLLASLWIVSHTMDWRQAGA